MASGVCTTPAMSRTAPVGAFSKRGRVHPVDHTDLLLADFYPLHQRPQDDAAGVPVSRRQATANPLGELVQVTDHQPQLFLLRLRCGLGLRLGLQLRQPLFGSAQPRLKLAFV